MATDAAEIWRHCFEEWPAEVDRRGVLITSFGDQIPFEAFATSSEMLLIERRSPDTVGARIVMVPYGNIQGLKIVDVVKLKDFQSLGFTTPPPRK
ncbi:MAG: hypothetical protein HY288_03645 [Planctomycetia bacterium]|nr:hypothetical protein [Planctomycetia bacterium]